MIDSSSSVSSTVPTQYGITLDRKITVEDFISAVSRAHRKPMDKLVLFTVFNNELLNKL